MDAAAERRQQADAPVAELVEAALDDDRAVVRDGAGGGLVVEIAQHRFGRGGVEIVLADETIDGRAARHAAQLAHELADRVAEFDRASGLVAVPERHLARFAGRRRDQDPVVRDLFDAPGRGAERERLADLRLEHHLLVELADAGRPIRAGQEDAVQPAIGNRAGVGDRHALGAFASFDHVADAIPGDARPQLRELVGRIASRQHVEDALERAAAQVGKRRRPPDEREEVVHRPGVARRDGDDLLREHVERVARIARRFDRAVVHRPGDGGAGHEVAAELGKDDAFADGAGLVAGAADALQAAGHRRRRFDLHDQIDGAHVDAELERGGGDERRDLSGLEQIFDLGARLPRERPVMRAHQRLAGQLVERAGQPLGQPAAVDEQQRRLMRANQLEQTRMDGGPDGGAC